jgi:DNA-binding transcriptional regulator GbsR (MarR family)
MKQLIENNISLQKKSIDLIEATNKLTKKIDKLVNLFEEASKHVGEVEVGEDKVKQLAAKLESLLEQNKDIAKGLLLLERYVREKSTGYNVGLRGKPLPKI